jgi:hypothetical protein
MEIKRSAGGFRPFRAQVKCARIRLAVTGTAAPAAEHSWARGRPGLAFQFLHRRSPCSKAAGRFGAHGEVRAHLATGGFAATPSRAATAFAAPVASVLGAQFLRRRSMGYATRASGIWEVPAHLVR